MSALRSSASSGSREATARHRAVASRLALALVLLAIVGAAAWCSSDAGRSDSGQAGAGGSDGEPGGSEGSAGTTGSGGAAGEPDAGRACAPGQVDGIFVFCCNGLPCRGNCDNNRCVCFDELGAEIANGCGEGSFCCMMTSVKGCVPVSEAARCRGGPP